MFSVMLCRHVLNVCPVHQVIVHEVPGQELEVEVYDKDPDQDDFLGRYIVHVSSSSLSPSTCPFSWRLHVKGTRRRNLNYVASSFSRGLLLIVLPPPPPLLYLEPNWIWAS